jgi:hypothetical protein
MFVGDARSRRVTFITPLTISLVLDFRVSEIAPCGVLDQGQRLRHCADALDALGRTGEAKALRERYWATGA